MGKLIDLIGLAEFKSKLLNLIGKANGIAGLDSSGKIPSSQLPSYVDDVLEYESSSGFPTTGETGKIYVDKTTNKTYRWSGSAYVVISETISLGETSSTAYRGDRGKTAYDHASAKGSAFSSGLYKITTNAQGHVTAATAVTESDVTNLIPTITSSLDETVKTVNGKSATNHAVVTAIKRTISIPVSSWSGSGPYTYTFSDTAIVSGMEVLSDLLSDEYAQLGINSYTVQAGKLIISTTVKPTSVWTLTVILGTCS